MIEVQVAHGERLYHGTLVNISECGAYLACAEQEGVGQELRLDFAHPRTGELASVPARVTRLVRPGQRRGPKRLGGDKAGMGLQLLFSLSELQAASSLEEDDDVLPSHTDMLAVLDETLDDPAGVSLSDQGPPAMLGLDGQAMDDLELIDDPPDGELDGGWQRSSHSDTARHWSAGRRSSDQSRNAAERRYRGYELPVRFSGPTLDDGLGRVMDASAHGLFVAAAAAPRLGSALGLVLDLQGSGLPGEIALIGEVVRVGRLHGSEGEAGFAVQIGDFDSARDKELYARYLAVMAGGDLESAP